ncbi:MAG: 2-iminoacetate synthase ThiH [Candidatus Omnitrophica bacterium]|nr:2-iminoacetate synthase ThiH [Candidatus Omnitrophota bacterium]
MSFYDVYKQYKDFDIQNFFGNVESQMIQKALNVPNVSEYQFLSFLSSRAEPFLEQMATRSSQLTRQYFGKTIQLYTPMYVSNYCENECVYCGFNRKNKIQRKKLSFDEVKKEAEFISQTGLKHILLLTGSSRAQSPVGYVKECVKILQKYFSSVSLEVYTLTTDEYKELIDAGVDGLTVYQEVYDEVVYSQVHQAGPKSDYLFRLDAPERALSQRMRTVNIGVLLGLSQWQKEVFLLGLHAQYLQDKFFDSEISISLPRLRPAKGMFQPACVVEDKSIVQMILALRIFLPRLGITLSTRESAQFRENLLSLGITRMSAGSTTEVGGHTAIVDENKKNVQFEISDTRSVLQMIKFLEQKGYQPVLKDWMAI